MKMEMNIQHSTFNIQRLRRNPLGGAGRRWALNVKCSVFLFFQFAAVSTFAQTPTNTLPLLIPAYGEIPPTFLEQNGTIVIIDVIVFLAVAAAVAWEVFRPKPAPVLPPEKIAREALARLQAQPEDGRLLSEVSQILRRYIGAAFDFPGGEMTTAEFCTGISKIEKISPELGQTISGFLGECDVRKFSPANSPAPFNAVTRALELVELITKATHGQAVCATKP